MPIEEAPTLTNTLSKPYWEYVEPLLQKETVEGVERNAGWNLKYRAAVVGGIFIDTISLSIDHLGTAGLGLALLASSGFLLFKEDFTWKKINVGEVLVSTFNDFSSYTSMWVPKLYSNVMQVLVPGVDTTPDNRLPGITRTVLTNFFNAQLISSRDVENIFVKHVVSRLCLALYGLAMVVTRAVDGVLGLLAATVSLFTLGKYKEINAFAYRHLQITGIVGDLFGVTALIINPWLTMNTDSNKELIPLRNIEVYKSFDDRDE